MSRLFRHLGDRLLHGTLCIPFMAVALISAGCGLLPSDDEDEEAPPPEPSGLAVVDLAVGEGATCALLDDGAVRCWGAGDDGALGTGRDERDAVTPVQVDGVDDARAIVMGGSSGDLACAFFEGGEVSCWGHRSLNPAERPSVEPTVVPALEGVVSMAFAHGGGTACAVDQEGAARCWGSNAFGTVGAGSEERNEREPVAVQGIDDAVQVACGQNHCCARHRDGTASCWGANRDGQVDPGLQDNQHAPVRLEGVAGLTDLAASTSETCGVTEEGVVCWGGRREEPELLDDLDDVVELVGRNNMCARHGDGSVSCWGRFNRSGQLGRGHFERERDRAPQRVEGVQGAKALAVGLSHVCAAVDEGAVCWGSNQRGALGDGTLVDRATPVQVRHLLDEAPPEPGPPSDIPQGPPQAWPETLPEGCERSEQVRLRHERFDQEAFPVTSAYAQRDRRGRLTVHLANYPMDPEDLRAQPRGDQLRIILPMARQDDDLSEIGTYRIGRRVERRTQPQLRHRAATARNAPRLLGRRADEESGQLELVHADEAWICGTLQFQTEEAQLEGPFAAPVVE